MKKLILPITMWISLIFILSACATTDIATAGVIVHCPTYAICDPHSQSCSVQDGDMSYFTQAWFPTQTYQPTGFRLGWVYASNRGGLAECVLLPISGDKGAYNHLVYRSSSTGLKPNYGSAPTGWDMSTDPAKCIPSQGLCELFKD